MRYLVGPSHAKALPRGFRTASIRSLQPCLRKVSFRLLGLSLGLTGAIDGVPLDLQWGGTKHSTGRESRAKWARRLEAQSMRAGAPKGAASKTRAVGRLAAPPKGAMVGGPP